MEQNASTPHSNLAYEVSYVNGEGSSNNPQISLSSETFAQFHAFSTIDINYSIELIRRSLPVLFKRKSVVI